MVAFFDTWRDAGRAVRAAGMVIVYQCARARYYCRYYCCSESQALYLSGTSVVVHSFGHCGEGREGGCCRAQLKLTWETP